MFLCSNALVGFPKHCQKFCVVLAKIRRHHTARCSFWKHWLFISKKLLGESARARPGQSHVHVSLFCALRHRGHSKKENFVYAVISDALEVAPDKGSGGLRHRRESLRILCQRRNRDFLGATKNGSRVEGGRAQRPPAYRGPSLRALFIRPLIIKAIWSAGTRNSNVEFRNWAVLVRDLRWATMPTTDNGRRRRGGMTWPSKRRQGRLNYRHVIRIWTNYISPWDLNCNETCWCNRSKKWEHINHLYLTEPKGNWRPSRLHMYITKI